MTGALNVGKAVILLQAVNNLKHFCLNETNEIATRRNENKIKRPKGRQNNFQKTFHVCADVWGIVLLLLLL